MCLLNRLRVSRASRWALRVPLAWPENMPINLEENDARGSKREEKTEDTGKASGTQDEDKAKQCLVRLEISSPFIPMRFEFPLS